MNQFKLTIIGIIFGLFFPTATLASPDDYADPLTQITNVNQLRDVLPTDWAYEALRSLSDRFLNGALRQRPEGTLHPKGAVSLMGETTGHINDMRQTESPLWGDDWRATAPPQDPSAFL